MAADAGIEAHAVDDLPRVQPVGQRVAVQLVEEGHAHREVGVGKQLHRLGLGRAGEQDRHVRVQRARRQQLGKAPRLRRAVAHDDAGRVQVVVQRPAFAQELGREKDLVRAVFRPHPFREADGNGRFHDNGGLGRVVARLRDHPLDRRGVEAVGARVIVRGRGDDDVIGPGHRLPDVGRRGQVQAPVLQEIADVGVLDGRHARIHLVHAGGVDVQRHHLVPLRQQDGQGKAHVTQADNCDLHDVLPKLQFAILLTETCV